MQVVALCNSGGSSTSKWSLSPPPPKFMVGFRVRVTLGKVKVKVEVEFKLELDLDLDLNFDLDLKTNSNSNSKRSWSRSMCQDGWLRFHYDSSGFNSDGCLPRWKLSHKPYGFLVMQGYNKRRQELYT